MLHDVFEGRMCYGKGQEEKDTAGRYEL